jgi:hypothetical protein
MSGNRENAKLNHNMAPKIIKYVVLAVIMVNVAIIAYVFLGSSTPPPQPLPNPNGYDDFVKAGQMVKGNPSTNDTMSKEELAGLIATNAETLKLVRLGLSRECREPVEYSESYATKLLPELANFKQLVFLFCAEGRLAEMDGRTNDAAGIYLEGIRYGAELGRGGVLMSELVSLACENAAMSRLQRLADWVNAVKCREITGGLQTIDIKEEPIADMLEHEKLWSKRTFGIRGQLESLLMYKQQAAMTARVVAKIQATQLRRRQLILEFAARAYELEKGKPPQSVADLVPEYLKVVPKDPVTGKELGLGR